MKKIKVLIVAGTMGVGGIENQLMHLLRNADKSVYQIDFTTTEKNPFYKDEIVSLGSKCLKIPRTNGIHFIRYCKSLYKVIRDEQYDVIHSNELFHSGMVLLTARFAGVRNRFVHAHSFRQVDDPGTKSLKRRGYNFVMQKLIQWNATEFLACSSTAGKYLYGEKILKQDNYHLIFNSVDTSKFLDNAQFGHSNEFCDSEWINVIQVGRFSPEKNHLFTAEIAKEFKRRNKKIRILCAGNEGGEVEGKVREFIKEFGIEDYMLLLGVRKDVNELMHKASAFILPSLYEGMPLTLIEAQAAGLPCVVADTFSKEVDFNIGSVNWLDLDCGVSTWCDVIEKAANHGRYPIEEIKDSIDRNGFDSKDFAERICNLYKKAMLASTK